MTKDSRENKEIIEEVPQEFDIDAALNEKGFAEFLAAREDAEDFDIDDAESVENRFNIFVQKEGVKKNLKALYANQINREFDITLNVDDLKSVDAHFEKEALKNSDLVMKTHGKLELFERLPKDILKLEGELGKLGKAEDWNIKLETLRKDKANLDNTRKYTGFTGKARLALETIGVFIKPLPKSYGDLTNSMFIDKYIGDVGQEIGKLLEQRDALKSVKEKFGNMNKGEAGKKLTDIENQISEVENTLSTIAEADQLKNLSENLFGEIRKKMFAEVANISELAEAIQGEVVYQFNELLDIDSIESLDKAQNKLEALRKISKTTEIGVDPLGGVNEDDLQELIDRSIERVSTEMTIASIEDTNLGQNALTKLEKSLEPFIKRTKVGSKDGDESREFIMKTIEEVARALPNTTESKAKRLLLARIIIKMRK